MLLSIRSNNSADVPRGKSRPLPGLLLAIDHVQIFQPGARIKKHDRVVRAEESVGTQFSIRSQRSGSLRRSENSFDASPLAQRVHNFVIGHGQGQAAALLENIEN